MPKREPKKTSEPAPPAAAGGAAAAEEQEMTEEDGELPPDYQPPKRGLSEEELRQKLLDGEIDPETAAEQIKISKSAWRKQKGEFSKKGASEAQRILDGELPDDLTGPEGDAPPDEAEMMRRIMDGEM